MKDTVDGGSYQRVTSTNAHGRPRVVGEFENIKAPQGHWHADTVLLLGN